MSAKGLATAWISITVAICSIAGYLNLTPQVLALKAENGQEKERPRYRTVYACEGSTLNMECDAGHVINLIRANYGRFSITICNEHGNTEWSVNCMSPRSHRVLHDKCSQRQNCSVAASTRGFGDPCPGTLKYLEAHFQCVPVNPPSHTARPRPPWFIATKTTVSSITQDDPPLQQQRDRPAHQIDHGDDQGGGGPDSPGGRLSLEERLKGTQSDGDLSPMLPAFGDNNRAGTTTSSTTTLRPPPWLITNTTKNTTTTTTTERATTTTSSTSTAKNLTTTTSTTTEKPPQTNVDSPVSTGTGNNKGKDQKDSRTNTSHREEGSGGPIKKDDTVKKEEPPALSTTTLRPSLAEIPGHSEDTSEGTLIEASWCPPSSGRGLFWNWTRGGDTAVQPCPGGASGFAQRPCDTLGWTGPADLSECRSVWLSSLTQRAHTNNDAVLAVAHDLVAVTESRPLFGGDVTATARLLNSLARRMAGDVRNFPEGNQREAIVTELVGAAVETVSHLLGGGRSMAAWADLRGPEHRAAATDLLLGLEEAAFLLADNLHQEKTVNRAQTNILMRLQVLETRNVAAVTFPSTGETWLQEEPNLASSPTDPSSPTSFTDQSYSPTASFPNDRDDSPSSATSLTSLPRLPQDTITLPPEALIENSENGLVKMVFFSYDGLQHLLQPDPISFRYNQNSNMFRDPNETRVLNSRVLSASLGAGRHIELSEPVVLTFAMIRQVNVTNPACVFWDYTTSSWSEEGCRVLRYNLSHTVCECDHLTNFAVLMDVHATPLAYSHSLALSIITYVGCVVSIVCLLLATIVFHAFRGLKSDRTTIHKNLCMCLLLAEVVFLGGVNQTEQAVVCGIVAGLLHFLFLAAFAWMFCEGFQLYVMLVEVFETEKSRVRWYYMASYGLPAVIVAISAIVDPLSYGTQDACWLRADNYFIFAFVGPVIAVLLANCVFLCMSVVIMCRHASVSSTLKNKEHTKLASISTWVRGAIVLMFLLGLTWTFGLLYLNQASVVMAYVFTVLNSLQGLFIFIFHCIQNDKLVPRLTSGRWTRKGGSPTSTATPSAVPVLGPVISSSLGGLSASMGVRASGGSRGGSLSRTPQRSSNRSARLHHTMHTRTPNHDIEDEKYSFKSCGRDSGHGGSEQEDSPRTGPSSKIASLKMNNNIASHLSNDQFSSFNAVSGPGIHDVAGPLPGPEALLPDYRMAGDTPTLRLPAGAVPNNRMHRNNSPWNHTYTEIPDGVRNHTDSGVDPVYEEIEREGRSDLQISDLSDEDGRRQSSDISRQSSRSYGDHRPLLPYTLPERHNGQHPNQPPPPQYDPRMKARYQQQMQQKDGMMIVDNNSLGQNQFGPQVTLDHTIMSPGHIMPMSHAAVTTAHTHALPPGNGHITGHNGHIVGHHFQEQQIMDRGPQQTLDVSSPQLSQAVLAALGHQLPVVHPLSEPNLRNWEAAQRHRDLQHLQQLGEMTVAVLNGEQVVCKLKPPLAPIHESPGGGMSSAQVERHAPPPTYSHC